MMRRAPRRLPCGRRRGAVAVVEHFERRRQRLAAVVELLVLGHHAFLALAVVSEPVLPFAALAIVADRSVERRVAAETAVHVDHVLLGDAEPLGDEPDL